LRKHMCNNLLWGLGEQLTYALRGCSRALLAG
jgi:hypothetical protein